MKKRIMSMALCLVMLASVLPMSGFASDATAPAATAAPGETAAPTASADPAAAPDDDTTEPAPTPIPAAEPTDTPQETDTPAVDEAVAAVQEFIDALPAAEDVSELVAAYLNGEELSEADSAALTDAYDRLDAAAEAYYALTDAQREQVDSSRLESLAALFNSEVEPLTGGNKVAEIGTKSYAKLQDALNVFGDTSAKRDDSLIVLLNPINESPLELKGNVPGLNLAGHSVENPIDLKGHDLPIKNEGGNDSNASVTIINTADYDSGIDTEPNLAVSGGNVTVRNQSETTITNIYSLTVSGGTVNITGGNISVLTVENDGNVTVSGNATVDVFIVNGGTVTLKDAAPTNANKPNVDTLTVTGGNVTIASNEPQTGAGTIDFFNVKLLTVKAAEATETTVATSGTVTFTSGIINSVDVGGGSLTINGGKVEYGSGNSAPGTKSGNGFLTITGGNVSLNSGNITAVNLGLSVESGTPTGGTLTVGVLGSISELCYYYGNLEFGDLGTSKHVINELTVKVPTPKLKLTSGGFWSLSPYEEASGSTLVHGTLLDILADGYAIFERQSENGTVTLKNAATSTRLSGFSNNTLFIAEHDCDFNTDTQSKIDGVQCACGRTCQHTTVGTDGKCTACSTQFAVVGTKTDADRKLYERATDFISGKLEDGYTYTLYTDLGSTDATVTPDLNENISVTFALNGHSLAGTLQLGDDDNTLGLAITGSGDLSGAKVVLKGSTLDLSAWAGSNGSRTLGGISADSTVTGTVGSAIKLPDGYVLADENGTAISSTTQLTAIPTGTLKITKCSHSTINSTNGQCSICGNYYVAKLGETYFPYDGSDTANAAANAKKAFYGTPATSGGLVLDDNSAIAAAMNKGGTLTLLTSVNVKTSLSDQFKIDRGTFTLDLNGNSIGTNESYTPVMVCGTANVTITGNVNSSSVYQLYVGYGKDTGGKVTIESGEVKNVNLHTNGTLNFKNGTIGNLDTGYGSTTNVSGGTVEKMVVKGDEQKSASTVNVTGGTITTLDLGDANERNNYPGILKVSNGTDSKSNTIIPTINTLNYYEAKEVTLTGGQYKKIVYGDKVTDKNIVNFLGDGYAYHIGDSVDGSTLIDASQSEYKNGVEINETETSFVYVCSHAHTFTDATLDYPKCDCGYECHHPTEKIDAATGVCDICQKQLPLKETLTDNTVKYHLKFPSPITGKSYQLLADMKLGETLLTVQDSDEVTIDLNSHSFVKGTGEDAKDPTLIANKGADSGSATIKITGKGSLADVVLKVRSSTQKSDLSYYAFDLTGWDGDSNGNKTVKELILIEIKNDPDSPNTAKFAKLNAGITLKKLTVSYATSAGENPTIITPANLLATGCAFKKSENEYNEYVKYKLAFEDNAAVENLTVVDCLHSWDKVTTTCEYCGQGLVAKVTVASGESKAITYYTDITKAFEYANTQSGCTVELLTDCSADSLTASGNFTLNLNGRILTIGSDGSGELNVTGGLTVYTDSRTIENGAVRTYGEINGNVIVANSDNAKLTVNNTPKPSENEICIPKIKTLTVSGGTVSLTGGEYDTVTVNATGKTLGDLLGNTQTEEYGFNLEEVKPKADNQGTWIDHTWETSESKETSLSTDNNNKKTLTVEKLPIKSIETGSEPAAVSTTDGGKVINVTYRQGFKLKITKVTGADGDILELGNDDKPTEATETSSKLVECEWWKENGKVADPDEPYLYTFGGGSTGGQAYGVGDHTVVCKVTVDGYSETVEFNLHVTPIELDADKTNQIVPPKPHYADGNECVYEPVLNNGKYDGTGKPKALISNTPDSSDDFTSELTSGGCQYEFESTDKDENGNPVWKNIADFKPSDVGTYTVRWRLNGVGKYKFDNSDYYYPPESNNTVTATIVPQTITGITIDKSPSKTYDGTTTVPTDGLTITLIYEYEEAGSKKTKRIPLDDSVKDIVELTFDSANVGTGKTITAKLNPNSTPAKNFTFGENIEKLTVKAAQSGSQGGDAQEADATGTIKYINLSLTAPDKTALAGQTVTIPNPLVPGTDYKLEGDFAKDETAESIGLKAKIDVAYINDGGNEVHTLTVGNVGKTYKIRPEVNGSGYLWSPESGFKSDSESLLDTSQLTSGGKQPCAIVACGNYAVWRYDGTLTVVDCVVKATAGANGSISTKYGTLAADGTIHVTPYQDITFNITPNPGYVVASVTVDGVNLGALSTYTFKEVKENHTIHATFMLPYANPQTGVEVD